MMPPTANTSARSRSVRIADDPNYVKVKGLSSYLASNLDTKDDTFLAKYNGLVSPMPTCHIGMFKTYHVGNMFTYEENPTGINGSQGCLYEAMSMTESLHSFRTRIM